MNFERTTLSVIIPTWNGRHLLAENLPSLLQSIRQAGDLLHGWEIIVVDDASGDDTGAFLQANYPGITVLRNSQNLGFSPTCNAGIAAAASDWLLLLNNDVKLEPSCIGRLLEVLRRQDRLDDLFTLSGTTLHPSTGRVQDGAKIPVWKAGMMRVPGNFYPDRLRHGKINPAEQSPPASLAIYPSLQPCGCCALWNREKVAALGGFDELFKPFNWEETDLAYRAWKRGWPSVYFPYAFCYHQANTTIGRYYQRKQAAVISFRNRLFFQWKNFTDPSFMLSHLFFLLLRAGLSWLAADWVFYASLREAARQIPAIRAARAKEAPHRRLSDTRIYRLIRLPREPEHGTTETDS